MRRRQAMRNVAVVCILSLALSASFNLATAEEPKKPEKDPAARLTEIDLKYRAELQAILVEAKLQDDKALVADIEARLKVTGTYASKAARPQAKTLSISGSMDRFAELVVGQEGLYWRDPAPYSSGPADLVVNGVDWAYTWAEGGKRDALTSVRVNEVLKYSFVGNVTVRRIPRGSSVGFIIQCRKSERTNFALKIVYR